MKDKAVDIINDAVDDVIDLYRDKESRSPTQQEITIILEEVFSGRSFEPKTE